VRWEITTNLVNTKDLVAKQQLHCRRIVDKNKMHLVRGDRSVRRSIIKIEIGLTAPKSKARSIASEEYPDLMCFQ
jgi:hypothetical protein